ncbi:hypothetical protein BH09ACT5_BH09ACT5_05210 [soil metagenome]
MRKLISVVIAAGLLASLAACTPATHTFASCEDGASASLVTAKGKLGDDPEAQFPTPLISKKPQVAVLSKGDGRAVTVDSGVDLVVSIYDGETGEPVPTQSGPITALTVRVFVSDGPLPFADAARCATVGSRLVTTGKASDILGSDSGLDDDTTLVVVSDIESSFPAKADGADQPAQPGYPSVALAPNGRAGLTFASEDVPDGLGAVTLKQGSGTKVKKGDSVIANITGVVWGADAPFYSSWDNNAPTTVAASDLDASGNGLVPALAKAVVGQKVGSQLLVVVSPDELAEGQLPTGASPGDTLVYVFDILGIAQ